MKHQVLIKTKYEDKIYKQLKNITSLHEKFCEWFCKFVTWINWKGFSLIEFILSENIFACYSLFMLAQTERYLSIAVKNCHLEARNPAPKTQKSPVWYNILKNELFFRPF